MEATQFQFSTADLSDAHSNVQAVGDVFKSFGAVTAFYGIIHTVQVFEDNVLVKAALETDGKGKVLVVDGRASLKVALMGDNLAALAIKNGWEGVVINGAIRDSKAINAMGIGVRALGTNPLKSVKKGLGQNQISVNFAGLEFVPGHYIYVDDDGILVSEKPLL
ncbi:MAG: ribonuclease E activity regulator RraA [Chitinophagales bacterium]|nr:ribonuclease E activity regulator RraA [Chitinophagales bacterium]